MSYRPICDTWLLARSKTKYYGAYPAGFLGRARDLLGVGLEDSVLHVCGGKVRDYPYRGLGVNDRTLDLDPACNPDFLQDCMDPLPKNEPDWFPNEGDRQYWLEKCGGWGAVLIDRPYTAEDADHYVPGATKLPNINLLLKNSLGVVRPGGRVGVLDYFIPRPPKTARFIACVGVIVGFGNRGRFYCVFERND